MPWAHRWSLLLLCPLAACGKHSDDGSAAGGGPAQPTAPSAASDAAAAAAADATPARAAETPPHVPTTAKERKAFTVHLRAGRKLEKKNDWAGAVAELEQAVALYGIEPAALSELSWAAFNAGKLDRAEETARRSAELTSDPRMRAASLYNLGRVLEQRGDKPAALAAYQRSHRLRTSPVVAKRIAGLGGKVAAGAGLHPCAALMSQDELCRCASRQLYDGVATGDQEPDWEHPRVSCRTDAAVSGMRVLVVDADSGRRSYQSYVLTQERDGKLGAAATLGEELSTFKDEEEIELVGAEQITVGARQVLQVHTVYRESHDPEVYSEDYALTEKRTSLCLWQEEFLTCPVTLVAERTLEVGATRWEEEPSADERREWEQHLAETYGAVPPISRAARFTIEPRADGTVGYRLASGEAEADDKAALARSHRLW